MAEQDALITVEEDELITAETTNANNRYLENKISENATTLTNYLERELTRVENELEGEITSAQTTLQQNINELSATVSGINFMPDYSAGISLSVNTDIVLTQDSFIVITGANGGGAYDNMTSFYINGQYIAQIPSTYKVFGTSFSAYVSKGETVRVQTSTGVNNFVAYPLKGETNA